MAAHFQASVLGVLGNLTSSLVFLSPVPTFYRIYKRKCTEGFQSFPYPVALFSASLWIYYAILKGVHGTTLYIVTINSFGCAIESIYLTLFIIYAPRKAKIFTIKLLMTLNVGIFSCILFPTLFLSQGALRLKILGCICSAFVISVSAAPLSIMWRVIRTKSVEFMPFFLSFFLTLNAIVWFFYGLIIEDKFVAWPNVLGMVFGACQMILYRIYKRKEKLASINPTDELTEVYQAIDPNHHTDEAKVADRRGASEGGDQTPNDHKVDINQV